MDALFWFTMPDPAKPLAEELILTALKKQMERNASIHPQIRMWIDEQGPLDRLKPEVAIEQIRKLINEHRFKPQNMSRKSAEGVDRRWGTPQLL